MSATPAPTHALSEFQAGVTAALRSWSALRTAVEGEWGGIESKAKAEDLRASVFSLFDGSSDKPKISLEELEDNLFDYMETEFSIVLEDGSERQVADAIFRMYEGCAKGDVSFARQLVASAEQVATATAGHKVVVHTEGEMDKDEEDGDEVVGSGGAGGPASGAGAAAAYAAGGLFGPMPSQKPPKDAPPPRQLGEKALEQPQVEVDDDGFAPVMRKGKRR
jgi:pre-rRNA-processing protein TSR2